MSETKVNILHKCRVKTLGEGPVWLEDSSELAFIDMMDSKVIKIHGDTNEWKEISIPGESCISLAQPTKKKDQFVGLCQHKVVAFDWNCPENLKVLEMVEEGENSRFNDGKADRSGRLWCGTMGEEREVGVLQRGIGNLYVVNVDGSKHSIKKAFGPCDLSNGIDWSFDNRVMYFIDTLKNAAYAFDYDATTGEISNKRVAIDFSRHSPEDGVKFGYPDGCCIDAEDKLWIAGYFGANVCRFDPVTGDMLQRVTFDSIGITSCCFGGPHLNQLYVTAANRGYENGGSVYRVDGLNVRGLLTNRVNSVEF